MMVMTNWRNSAGCDHEKEEDTVVPIMYRWLYTYYFITSFIIIWRHPIPSCHEDATKSLFDHDETARIVRLQYVALYSVENDNGRLVIYVCIVV